MVRILAGIARNPESPPNSRVTAASCLLDRGYGKPQQNIEMQGDVRIVIRKMLSGELIDVEPNELEQLRDATDTVALPPAAPDDKT